MKGADMKKIFEIKVVKEEDQHVVLKPRKMKISWERVFVFLLVIALFVFVIFYLDEFRVLFPRGYGYYRGIELK